MPTPPAQAFFIATVWRTFHEQETRSRGRHRRRRQIGYALLFRIASGEMLGKDQPVILQLLEIPDEKAQKALKGVMMELRTAPFRCWPA
jgi:hypothetical protein